MTQAQKPYYITTTLPYLNADPHIGFAAEIIQADILARYKRVEGYDVFFNTGTDEHGLKIYQKAMENNISGKEYTDLYVLRFQALKEKLDLTYTHFIRTTDAHHISAAQEFWRRCEANGDIYKHEYESKYCVGCEMEKHDTELENGRCFIHQNLEIQIIKEENYFFRQSKYQEALLNLYTANPNFVIPGFRQKEISTFVEQELRDFSISRLKSKMPWGIEVPGDPDHVMYVWFDALVNYISTTGWPEDTDSFTRYWPGIQLAGKDNLRQQTAMWQSMLLSAGLPTSAQVYIHGHITHNGQKMSKSLGNVINPVDVVDIYGTDALRYYIAHQLPAYDDGDFTMEKFKEAYNANLANGLGNLVSRIMKMVVSYDIALDEVCAMSADDECEIFREMSEPLGRYNFSEATELIWKRIRALDQYIQGTEPFKTIKVDPEKAKKDIVYLVSELYKISYALGPILPETAKKISELIKSKAFPEKPLFERKD